MFIFQFRSHFKVGFVRSTWLINSSRVEEIRSFVPFTFCVCVCTVLMMYTPSASGLIDSM